MRLFLLIISVVVLFISCDKVNGPYTENISAGASNRKIIIEDFTGQRCANCPQAREVIDQLSELYPERIIPIAIHCGGFAIPFSSGIKYRYDFRTPAGNALQDFYAISDYPNGLVNSVAKEEMVSHGSWGTKVSAYVNTTSKLSMEITNTYDTTAHTAIAKVKTTALSYLNKNLYIVAFVTEDSIINWQKVDLIDSATYVHRHVLRKALSDPFGDPLKNDAFLTDSYIESQFSFSYADTDWKIKNLHIVAYIYDFATKEILQAEEKKILSGH